MRTVNHVLFKGLRLLRNRSKAQGRKVHMGAVPPVTMGLVLKAPRFLSANKSVLKRSVIQINVATNIGGL
jgi:hypothetical protein